MVEVIKIFAPIYFISHMMFFIIGIDNIMRGNLDVFDFFNPIRNYNTWTSMNWFGVIIGTVFLHVLIPVYAMIYWFYKLCTFGRKQERE